MDIKSYFNQKGYVFGVSSKFEFGEWTHDVKVFTDFDEANQWLHTEEYDFRERELMTKYKAAWLAGKKAVKDALNNIKGE